MAISISAIERNKTIKQHLLSKTILYFSKTINNKSLFMKKNLFKFRKFLTCLF